MIRKNLPLISESSCISVNGEKYILFTVTDIADEKRRRALERTFFHDVLNTASAVYGISEILPEIEEKDEMLRMGKLLNVSATQLISEMKASAIYLMQRTTA